MYLKYTPSSEYYPDVATHLVAIQSESVIQSLGYEVTIEPNKREPAMNIVQSGIVLARVAEGCNAISVMLLFVAFILAFFNGKKKTFLFILGGLALIYGMNILRIALLTVGIIEYPEYTELMHGTIFPAVIYGTVFLLWLGWVNGYAQLRDE
jgi:exosortase family protein XrtF